MILMATLLSVKLQPSQTCKLTRSQFRTKSPYFLDLTNLIHNLNLSRKLSQPTISEVLEDFLTSTSIKASLPLNQQAHQQDSIPSLTPDLHSTNLQLLVTSLKGLKKERNIKLMSSTTPRSRDGKGWSSQTTSKSLSVHFMMYSGLTQLGNELVCTSSWRESRRS